jgi:hypothetical protein
VGTTGYKDRAAYKNTYLTNHQEQDPTPIDGVGNPTSIAWQKNYLKYLDSLLQAWWPKELSPNSLDAAYQYLPKVKDGFWYTHT